MSRLFFVSGLAALFFSQSLLGGQFIRIGKQLNTADNFVLAQELSADGSIALGWESAGTPWVWSADKGFTNLGDFFATSMSANGLTLVGSVDAPNGWYLPARWRTGQEIESLPALSDYQDHGSAYAVSSDGLKSAGFTAKPYKDDGEFFTSTGSQATLWDGNSNPIGLGFLSAQDIDSFADAISGDGRVVFGTSGHAEQPTGKYKFHAFRWTEATGMTDLGANVLPWGQASHDGSVLVGALPRANQTDFEQWVDTEAMRWNLTSGVTRMGFLPSHNRSEAVGVSSDGTVVLGTSWNATESSPDDYRAFVWDEFHGMRDLETVLRDQYGINNISLPLTDATSISNDRKTILGFSRDSRKLDTGSEAWMVKLDRPIGAPATGDFNDDGLINVTDIDLLSNAIFNQTPGAYWDLDKSGTLDTQDLSFMVKDILRTWAGDANLDGLFSTSDLILGFQGGQYEDATPRNSGWATGDWNADLEFSTSDLIVAFQDGGYESGPRAAVQAVPEPTSAVMMGIAGLLGWRLRRRLA